MNVIHYYVITTFILYNELIESSNQVNDVSRRDDVTILFWTNQTFRYNRHMYDKAMMNNFKCDFQCKFTSDRSQLNTSSVVVFHLFTMRDDVPLKQPEQIWVLWNQEPPTHVAKNFTRLDGLFNWTMTYHPGSDVQIKQFVIRRRKTPAMPPGVCKAKQLNDLLPIGRGNRLVAAFISNCDTWGGREKYLNELKAYISIDVYGKCGERSCGSFGEPNVECYKMLKQSGYMFYLAFENSLCRHYVTEKFYDALKYGLVPIVFGGAEYWNMAPTNSYIDARQFEPKRLAEYLLRLTKWPSKYDEYHEWRTTHEVIDIDESEWACELCRKTHKSINRLVNKDIVSADKVIKGADQYSEILSTNIRNGLHYEVTKWHVYYGQCLKYEGNRTYSLVYW